MAEAAAATRRVKIVATLGPACADTEAVTELASVGADAFRLNTAHLTPEDIPSSVATVRAAERRVGRPLAVLCDLAGPKLRVARDAPPAALAVGSVVSIGGAGSAAAVRVEGFDPAAEYPAVPFRRCDNHLNLARQLGLGTNRLEEIAIAGPAIADVRYPFNPA